MSSLDSQASWFAKLEFQTSRRRKTTYASKFQIKKHLLNKLDLTPVIEELTQLHLTSNVKRPRDDFYLSSEKVSLSNFAIACQSLKESHRMMPESITHYVNEKSHLSRLKFLKEVYHETLSK